MPTRLPGASRHGTSLSEILKPRNFRTIVCAYLSGGVTAILSVVTWPTKCVCWPTESIGVATCVMGAGATVSPMTLMEEFWVIHAMTAQFVRAALVQYRESLPYILHCPALPMVTIKLNDYLQNIVTTQRPPLLRGQRFRCRLKSVWEMAFSVHFWGVFWKK